MTIIDSLLKHKKSQPWYQYSLRSLLLCVTFFAILCSWFAVKIQGASRQRMLVENIERLDGEVQYERSTTAKDKLAWIFGRDFVYCVDGVVAKQDHDSILEISKQFPTLTWIRLVNAKDSVDLRRLRELQAVKRVFISHCAVGDEDIECLNGMANLETLFLCDVPLTDAGLNNLCSLPHLRTLFLSKVGIGNKGLDVLTFMGEIETLSIEYSKITDDGLGKLSVLRRLAVLDVSNNNITDAGLKEFGALQGIRSLMLDHTNITDTGLDQICHLNRLEDLSLIGTQVSDNGLDGLRKMANLRSLSTPAGVTDAERKRLKKALPNLIIDHDLFVGS